MIPWKHRMYAFLLRRVLGPFLDEASLRQLHQSLDVSLSSGRCTLTDISLNTDFLLEKLKSLPVAIRSARIRRLTVQLELREKDHGDNSQQQQQQSSLAWRALQLTDESAHVSLSVHLELDGLCIELEPHTPVKEPPKDEEEEVVDEEVTAGPKSMLSSYLDAALSSLDLSVDWKNLSVLLRWTSEERENWVEVRLQAASYSTVPASRATTATRPPEIAMNYETTLHKALQLQQVTILVGGSEFVVGLDETRRKDAKVATIALLEGVSRATFRIIEYSSPDNASNIRTQQDLEVTLQQKFNLSMDVASLTTLGSLVRLLHSATESSLEAPPKTTAGSLAAQPQKPENREDEEDMNTLTSIMKQYQEARQRVERNQMRGGILVPGSRTDEGGESTFDVFFDANDKSFYHYSTVLRESIMMGGSSSRSSSMDDWVHTRLRFHLQEGGVKVAFPMDGIGTSRRHEEYILLTVNDLNLSSSLSSRSQDYSFSIDRLEVEDSVLVTSHALEALVRKVEIDSLVRFAPECDPDTLVQSPCLSMTVSTHRHKGIPSVEVELELDPLEIVYRAPTLRNLTRLSDDLKKAFVEQGREMKQGENHEEGIGSRIVRLSAVCPSLSVELPLSSEKDCRGLFDRCAFELPISHHPKSSFGVRFDAISINVNRNESQRGEDVAVEFLSAFLFASSYRNEEDVLTRTGRGFDILALAGRAEVAPCIPVSMKIWQDSTRERGRSGENTKTPGEETFPSVPLISSFKARQEDEDEDLRVDRVLCSKLRDIDVSTRKQLRGVDAQDGMLENVSRSDTVVSFHVPEFMCDLTADEITILYELLILISFTADGEEDKEFNSTNESSKKFLSLSLVCDSVSVAIHEPLDGLAETSTSFALKANTLKTNVLTRGGKMCHSRFLLHDFHFCQVDNLVQFLPAEALPDSARRISCLRRRVASNDESIARPIFYRSQLFDPISQSNPAMLVDLVLPPCSTSLDKLDEKSIHCTLYDVTHRYDYDAHNWVDKLKKLVTHASPGEGSELDDGDVLCSLTKVFVSVADCNIDYTSSWRFKTPGRVIARLGDMRFSSNIVSPGARNQAFSLSIGDVSIYLCSSRFPYNFENSRLVGAATLMRKEQLVLDAFARFSRDGISAETVLHEMNYRTLLMLDSLDAVLVISNEKPKEHTDPYTSLSLTIGEIGLFCCKDSFARFVGAVGDISAEMAALDDAAFAKLKAAPPVHAGDEMFYDTVAEVGEDGDNDSSQSKLRVLDELKKQSALRPTPGTEASNDHSKDFLLDGYDWTAIDKDEDNVVNIPSGEEQTARWYKSEDVDEEKEENKTSDDVEILPGTGTSDMSYQPSLRHKSPRIFSHHFPLRPVSDPLGDGDMDAPKYAASTAPPQVSLRVLVHDLSIKVRCFDGFDWPELLDEEARSIPRKGPFLIDEVAQKKTTALKEKVTAGISERQHGGTSREELTRKAKLMGELLAGHAEPSTTFEETPLPEEKGRNLKEQAEIQRLSRRASKYFQFSASGVNLRLDSMEESRDHRLASCLNLKAQDFFVAETISSGRPIKMAGEWVNDQEHPRDTKDGLLAVKMVTWHASKRVTDDNEIANDEAEFALRLLPLRCFLDQRAIRFARSFFAGDDNDEEGNLPAGLHAVPPPLLESFRVRSFKLKVDYKPEKIDTAALRDGAFVELINLSPLDDMVLTLHEVLIENEVGFGPVVAILLRRWVQDICATQLVKFLSNSRPLEPITHVGGGAFDLVVLPWEALQNGESIRRGLRAGATSFAAAVAYEALTLSSRITEFVADTVSRVSAPPSFSSGTMNRMLPSRPIRVPRTVTDASPHAVESLSRGFQAASYKIVIVPYREYHRSGAQGAARSVLRGIPVAIAAPASGAAEALSFALLGARNQIRPDIRREEEASLRGLHPSFR